MDEEFQITRRLIVEDITLIKCKKYAVDHERLTKAKLISLRDN